MKCAYRAPVQPLVRPASASHRPLPSHILLSAFFSAFIYSHLCCSLLLLLLYSVLASCFTLPTTGIFILGRHKHSLLLEFVQPSGMVCATLQQCGKTAVARGSASIKTGASGRRKDRLQRQGRSELTKRQKDGILDLQPEH